MSTFGRDADRCAEIDRARKRREAEFEIRLRDAVRFAIATLSDSDLTDLNARWTAFTALTLRDWP